MLPREKNGRPSLLHDINDKVRMESPEIFRVLGKRIPEFVIPYIEQLQKMAESDSNRVVRIHSFGAIKATKMQSKTSFWMKVAAT